MIAISPPVQAVLDLFTTDLADVRFGDLDAPALARLASEAEAASEVVLAAEVALDIARVALHERQETLLQQAQRALAYARVYAEADLALTARLDAITLPRGSRRARPEGSTNANGAAGDSLVLTSEVEPARRPRGRPRKVPAAPEPTLEGLAQRHAEPRIPDALPS
jgi:hypothetical protein